MEELESYFLTEFERLTGFSPYPWQRRLFAELAAGRWPEVVDLPTGAGKTSILWIWILLRLCAERLRCAPAPTRLIWVVNRRAVVDQVTGEAERLRERLGEECDLAISTLRGQFADNEEWLSDPRRPAVVAGTVDMIGSRLLFRGYRSGRYHRPLQAGLAGVDSWIVNDEAHLSPAFARLLGAVRAMRPADKVTGKSFRILKLSATPADGAGDGRFVHDPELDAAESPHFRKIFTAPKTLWMHACESKNFESLARRLATEKPAPRTIVFIEQPERALEFALRLRKEGHKTALLTGTLRGLERDRLTGSADGGGEEAAVFRRFRSKESGEEPVWLVATSAAEVGVDLSCERMITGLAEADRLLQRFGRLNRHGEASAAEVHVAAVEPVKSERLRAAADYLRSLDGDASCRAVWFRRPGAEAKTELPLVARLETWRVDNWAQTTYRDSAMAPVEPWLHGKREDEEPETELAWRDDVRLLSDAEVDPEDVTEALEACPVRAHERLREPAGRVHRKFQELAGAMRAAGRDPDGVRLVLAAPDLTVELATLAEIARGEAERLGGKLALLPSDLGWLRFGMFTPEIPPDGGSLDVADWWEGEERGRRLAYENGEWRRLGGRGAGEAEALADGLGLARYAEQEGLRLRKTVRLPDSERAIAYFGPAAARKRGTNVPLPDHVAAVARRARTFAGALLEDGLERTFELAGERHDAGKGCELWQRAMGGQMDAPVAKSAAPANPGLLNGYRHEFGSLLRAQAEVDDELALHLIASHHAASRPYFERRQYDRERLRASEGAAEEAARRFSRLQRRYGVWGLAYLEAIFKCADASVSAEEGQSSA